jgi:hypothetical protein
MASHPTPMSYQATTIARVTPQCADVAVPLEETWILWSR